MENCPKLSFSYHQIPFLSVPLSCEKGMQPCSLARAFAVHSHMSHVMRKPVMQYANNKGADQPAHLRSLISAFVVGGLDSIIPLVSISKISSLCLASVAAQASLSLMLVANPEDRFSRDKAHIWN